MLPFGENLWPFHLWHSHICITSIVIFCTSQFFLYNVYMECGRSDVSEEPQTLTVLSLRASMLKEPDYISFSCPNLKCNADFRVQESEAKWNACPRLPIHSELFTKCGKCSKQYSTQRVVLSSLRSTLPLWPATSSVSRCSCHVRTVNFRLVTSEKAVALHNP